jgi:3-oxoacyl-[acyl-carrier-protein] synthase II
MSLAGLLASGDGSEEQLPRPFDAERTGTVLGEGCGVVGLELLSSARARGAAPLAELSGVGAACQHQDGATSPTATAIAAAMEQALRSAGVIPQQIDAVIARGDGSREGTPVKSGAQMVFSGEIADFRVFIKGIAGHLLAAAPCRGPDHRDLDVDAQHRPGDAAYPAPRRLGAFQSGARLPHCMRLSTGS